MFQLQDIVGRALLAVSNFCVFSPSVTMVSFRSLISLLSVCCLLCSCSHSRLLAQEAGSKEQAALVDGLLELLNEPAPETNKPATPAAGTAPATPGSAAQPTTTPTTDNPLQAVRQNMLTAADYLSKGLVNAQTRHLQSDIVVRLDELIEQLEQANAAEQNEQQRQQQRQQSSQVEQQPSTSPQSSPPTTGPAAPNPPTDGSDPQPGQAEQDPSSPAQKGQAANPTVDLVDPKTLQQNVWGQLPEQVRKQMQSRMVEQFLPSYRQQIEAYFQALIESPPENR